MANATTAHQENNMDFISRFRAAHAAEREAAGYRGNSYMSAKEIAELMGLSLAETRRELAKAERAGALFSHVLRCTSEGRRGTIQTHKVKVFAPKGCTTRVAR